MKKGFTLIETLIALAVLSISMMGIYSIMNMSLNSSIRAKERMFLIERGYDRVARKINFPGKAFPEVEDYNGVEVRYHLLEESVGIPGVKQVTMTISTDKAETKFIYYERTAGLQ